VYRTAQTSWHSSPFSIYSLIYSGLVGPGEGAAIPKLKCISPERRGVWSGPRAPSADLQLYIFPIPAGAPDSDGDGFIDLHERAGGIEPNAPLSPGPDRAHSRVDTDADHLSDQDDASPSDTNEPPAVMNHAFWIPPGLNRERRQEAPTEEAKALTLTGSLTACAW
jgi:hypothetical protein